jgi:hypothetical protein
VDLITGFIRGGAVLIGLGLVWAGAELDSIIPIILGVGVMFLFSTDKIGRGV